ncbi:MAG: hypothetical protein K2N28_07930 [Muribaculaceae bacterium]|nr:hypothetical protein [Muribaculaceae bacterium]
MKITLTESLIDSLTVLSPESANQVLNACRELMKLDNDAIEQYELEADAPQSLHDIVANMKKRAAAARRRRERREAKAAQMEAAETTPIETAEPAAKAVNAVNPEYAEAIALLFSDTPISTHRQCELMHRLVVFITERLTPTTQQSTPAPTATGKKSRRRRHRRSRSKRW